MEEKEKLEQQLDQVIELLKAIDWKLWLFLKANKYLDDEQE